MTSRAADTLREHRVADLREPDAATVKRAADAIGEALNGLPFREAQQESKEAARLVLARAALRAALAEGGSE